MFVQLKKKSVFRLNKKTKQKKLDVVVFLMLNLFGLRMWLPEHFDRNETQRREAGPEEEHTQAEGSQQLRRTYREKETLTQRASQPPHGNV